MKNFIFLIFVLFGNNIIAQHRYFSDTLYNNNYGVFASNIIPIFDGSQYAILQNLEGQPTSILYADSLGNKIRDTTFAMFTPTAGRFVRNSTISQLPNGHWVIPMEVNLDTLPYGGIVLMDKNLQDTIRTTKFRSTDNWPVRYTIFEQARVADDATIWISGRSSVSGTIGKGVVFHLDSNLNIISKQLIETPTRRLSVMNLYPLPNSKCLVTGIADSLNWMIDENDDIFLTMINDNGAIWHKQYGGQAYERDRDPFIFKGIANNTYHLVFSEGQNSPHGGGYPPIRLKAITFNTIGNTLSTRYLSPQMLNGYTFTSSQLADKSIILGRYTETLTSYNKGYFQKFSPTLDPLWTSDIPLPYTAPVDFSNDALPTAMVELSNGDFICTGAYSNSALDFVPRNKSNAWLGKMDSTGCWYDAGCSVGTTASPSPSQGEESVSIFPNPTTGTLHLTHTEGTALKSYTIADISGKIITQNTSIPNDNELNLDLPNGVYFLIINDINGQMSRHKVVVLK
jgi:hypothetical protein